MAGQGDLIGIFIIIIIVVFWLLILHLVVFGPIPFFFLLLRSRNPTPTRCGIRFLTRSDGPAPKVILLSLFGRSGRVGGGGGGGFLAAQAGAKVIADGWGDGAGVSRLGEEPWRVGGSTELGHGDGGTSGCGAGVGDCDGFVGDVLGEGWAGCYGWGGAVVA